MDLLKPRQSNGTTSPLQRALDAFGHSRLLAFDRDAASRGPTVEVSHEALLREWPLLRGWLRESRGEVRLQRQLAQAAAEWAAANRDPSFLLTGARLAQFEAWQANATVSLTPDERALIEASLAERARRQRIEGERHDHELALERRARRVFQALVFVFLAASVVAAGLAWWANESRVAAQVAQQESLANLDLSEAQRLAAESNRLFIEGRDLETAALLALSSIDRHYTPQGDEALSRAARQTFPVRLLAGHQGDVREIAFSADGRWMVSGDGLGHPLVWDVETGAIRHRLEGHTAFAEAADISPDGAIVATGSDDGTLRVWDAATGFELYRRDYQSPIWALDISKDGKNLLVAPWDGVARLLDLATGDEILSLPKGDSVVGAALSPDGHLALIGDTKGHVRLWDLTARKMQLDLNLGGWNWALDFSPDMSTFGVAKFEKMAYIVDTTSGEILHELPHTDEIFTILHYSPDGRYIYTGDSRGVAHLWDVATGLEARRYLHSTSVSGGAFTPDGRFLVTGSYDLNIRFWDLQALPIQLDIPDAGHTEGKLAFTADGAALLSQGQVYDGKTGALVAKSGANGFSGISRNGRTAYVLNFDPFELRVLEPESWTTRWSQPVTCPVEPYGVGISPDGSLIAIGGFTIPVEICIFNARTGAVVRSIADPAGVWGLAFTTDNRYLLAGDCESRARLYDLETGAEVRSFVLPGAVHCVNDVAISPDDTQVLLAGIDGQLILWNLNTGELIHSFVGHTGVVWGAAFSSDGRTVLSGGGDGTARLWDVATGAELRRFSGHTSTVWDVAFSSDGLYIATTSSDGTVKFWLTELDHLRTAVCASVPRDFTLDERSRYRIPISTFTCAKFADP